MCAAQTPAAIGKSGMTSKLYSTHQHTADFGRQHYPKWKVLPRYKMTVILLAAS